MGNSFGIGQREVEDSVPRLRRPVCRFDVDFVDFGTQIRPCSAAAITDSAEVDRTIAHFEP